MTPKVTPECATLYGGPDGWTYLRRDAGVPPPCAALQRAWLLNDGAALTDADPVMPVQDYTLDAAVSTPEREFTRALRIAVVPASLPFYMRQLGVYHQWLEYDALTAHGHAMIDAVARVESYATDPLRKRLHADAQARKARSADAGASRALAYHERVHEAAQARKDAEAKRKADEREAKRLARVAEESTKAQRGAARALALSALEGSWQDWAPGRLPLVLWLDLDTVAGIQRQATGVRPSAAIANLLRELVRVPK